MKALTLSALLLFSGLASALPPEARQLVDEAKASVEMVSMQELAEALKREGVLIVDIREPDELELYGRVQGAVNIPRGLLEFRIWPHVEREGGEHDKARPIYVYCKSGGRAALSALTLKRLGFTQVRAVEMRFDDWLEAGLPVEDDF